MRELNWGEKQDWDISAKNTDSLLWPNNLITQKYKQIQACKSWKTFCMTVFLAGLFPPPLQSVCETEFHC